MTLQLHHDAKLPRGLHVGQGAGKMIFWEVSSAPVQTQLEEIRSTTDYFYQESIAQGSERSQVFDYWKRDFLTAPGVWRGIGVRPYIEVRRDSQALFAGHSDRPTNLTTAAIVRLKSGAREFWVSNLDSNFTVAAWLKTYPLPLGLTNPTTETSLHKIYGKWTLLHDAFDLGNIWTNRESFVPYLNLSVKNGKKWREPAIQELTENRHTVIGSFKATVEGRLTYLREMQGAGLVICPRGNGLDTHRFYEALYMGCLPVVLRNSYSFRLASLYRLPVVGLAKWRELRDLDAIRSRIDKMRAQDWDYSSVRSSTWSRKVGSLLKESAHPASVETEVGKGDAPFE